VFNPPAGRALVACSPPEYRTGQLFRILALARHYLEAKVGIGRLKRRFRVKSAIFYGLHKLTLTLPELTLALHSC
jgi:hypothetical protein